MPKTWNFGAPRKGEPRIERRPVRVRRDGQTWSGHWEIEAGDLLVCSAYGSRRAPIGRTRDLKALAERLMGEIVAARRG